MDTVSFVAQARDQFVEQYLAFVSKMQRESVRGMPEIKFQFGETSQFYERMYCADFIQNNGQMKFVEFRPEIRAAGASIGAASVGKAALSIERLFWHDVVVHHDLATLPKKKLADWFAYWFDLGDKRLDEGAPVANIIHSMVVTPRQLSIDFGTAAPKAFWDLMELLEAAGATAIRVGGTEKPAAAKR